MNESDFNKLIIYTKEYIQNILQNFIKIDSVIYILMLLVALLIISIGLCIANKIFMLIEKLILNIYGTVMLMIQCAIYILKNKVITKNVFSLKTIGELPVLYGEISKLIQLINNNDGIEYHTINNTKSINVSDTDIKIEIIGIDIAAQTLDIKVEFDNLDKVNKIIYPKSKDKTKEVLYITCNNDDKVLLSESSFVSWWKYVRKQVNIPPKLEFKLNNLNSDLNNISVNIANREGEVTICQFEVNCTVEERDFLEKYKQLKDGFLCKGEMVVIFTYILQIIWAIIFLCYTGRIIMTIIVLVISLLITRFLVNINRVIIKNLETKISEIDK